MGAYERRYHRHLHDLGYATALAHHDPKQLDTAFTPPDRARESKYAPAQKWW